MKLDAINSNLSVEIQFRHMPKNQLLRRAALNQIDTFRSFAASGSRCEVIFDQSHSSQHGTVYQVDIRLYIPGQRLFVAHSTESGGSQELLFAALHDAFHDLRRQVLKTRAKRYYRNRRIAA